jgi:hypothetical protein
MNYMAGVLLVAGAMLLVARGSSKLFNTIVRRTARGHGGQEKLHVSAATTSATAPEQTIAKALSVVKKRMQEAAARVGRTEVKQGCLVTVRTIA